MAVTLSKDTKPEVKEEVKKESETKVESSKTESPINPTQIIIDALSTVKSKLEVQDHKHKEKIMTKLKGAIELLSQN